MVPALISAGAYLWNSSSADSWSPGRAAVISVDGSPGAVRALSIHKEESKRSVSAAASSTWELLKSSLSMSPSAQPAGEWSHLSFAESLRAAVDSVGGSYSSVSMEPTAAQADGSSMWLSAVLSAALSPYETSSPLGAYGSPWSEGVTKEIFDAKAATAASAGIYTVIYFDPDGNDHPEEAFGVRHLRADSLKEALLYACSITSSGSDACA